MTRKEQLLSVQFKPYTFEIEKGKIRELVMAIGDDNPIYTDLEVAKKEGFEGIPIPLTFLNTIDLWGGYDFEEKTEKLQVDKVKVLNGEQEFKYVKDIYAGDTITVKSRVVDFEVKKGSIGEMEFITLENQYRNQHDELVAISRNTLIHRI